MGTADVLHSAFKEFQWAAGRIIDLYDHNPLRIRIDVMSLPAWLLSGALALLAWGRDRQPHGPSISRSPRQIEGPTLPELFG
jgi:hypothetical protein